MNKKELLQKADELIKKANKLKELANEQDYILVPDKIKISYEYWKLAIHNWNQKLYYNKTYWDWCVSNAIWDETIKCKLTPCKYGDLEPWDVFYKSDYKKPNFKDLLFYSIKLNDNGYQYWAGKDCVNNGQPWNYYWKVEPI